MQASECVTAGVRDGDLGANGSGRFSRKPGARLRERLRVGLGRLGRHVAPGVTQR